MNNISERIALAEGKILEASTELERLRSELDAEKEPEKHSGLTMDEWGQLVDLGDVLIEARAVSNWHKRYLNGISEGRFTCMNDGATSKTCGHHETHWDNCRLIEDDRWRLNEGKQPVPDCVEVEVVSVIYGVKGKNIMLARDVKWSVVIAYRIIGVK